MIALVVLSIGILALSAIQTRSSSDVYSAGRASGALALAQERIEISRSAGYTNAVSDSGQAGPYAWAAHVDSVALELKQINVAVTWTENAAPRSLQLQTLLSVR
jgi:Tfp pilus assembly protein PilV